MKYDLAKLTEDQRKMIDTLEAQLDIVLVAYDGYKQEDENGTPLEQ